MRAPKLGELFVVMTPQAPEPLNHPRWLSRKGGKRAIERSLSANTQFGLAGHAGFLGSVLDTIVHIACEQIQVCSKYGGNKSYLIQCQANVQMDWIQSFLAQVESTVVSVFTNHGLDPSE